MIQKSRRLFHAENAESAEIKELKISFCESLRVQRDSNADYFTQSFSRRNRRNSQKKLNFYFPPLFPLFLYFCEFLRFLRAINNLREKKSEFLREETQKRGLACASPLMFKTQGRSLLNENLLNLHVAISIDSAYDVDTTLHLLQFSTTECVDAALYRSGDSVVVLDVVDADRKFGTEVPELPVTPDTPVATRYLAGRLGQTDDGFASRSVEEYLVEVVTCGRVFHYEFALFILYKVLGESCLILVVVEERRCTIHVIRYVEVIAYSLPAARELRQFFCGNSTSSELLDVVAVDGVTHLGIQVCVGVLWPCACLIDSIVTSSPSETLESTYGETIVTVLRQNYGLVGVERTLVDFCGTSVKSKSTAFPTVGIACIIARVRDELGQVNRNFVPVDARLLSLLQFFLAVFDERT